jgi:hypothetical protein
MCSKYWRGYPYAFINLCNTRQDFTYYDNKDENSSDFNKSFNFISLVFNHPSYNSPDGNKNLRLFKTSKFLYSEACFW